MNLLIKSIPLLFWTLLITPMERDLTPYVSLSSWSPGDFLAGTVLGAASVYAGVVGYRYWVSSKKRMPALKFTSDNRLKKIILPDAIEKSVLEWLDEAITFDDEDEDEDEKGEEQTLRFTSCSDPLFKHFIGGDLNRAQFEADWDKSTIRNKIFARQHFENLQELAMKDKAIRQKAFDAIFEIIKKSKKKLEINANKRSKIIITVAKKLNEAKNAHYSRDRNSLYVAPPGSPPIALTEENE